jgi:Domain of unknown function (DUF6438)
MKKNIFCAVFIGITLLATACKPKQKAAVTEPAPSKTATAKTPEKGIVAAEKTAATDKPGRGKAPRYMIVQIERTSCFGKCPAYKARIWNDGVAEYEGKNHVPNIGKFTAMASAETIKTLQQSAEKSNYLANVEKFQAQKQVLAPSDLPALNFYYNSGEKEGYVSLKGVSAPEFDDIIALTEKTMKEIKWEAVK